ncbi:unnamed protein product [Moneuplotes crassus]|uniref:Uncharacterized protein n=1 Tax=Euplotes crassus TaxID=5936 RepID=A0AAD1XDF5_EUPCR|nr:unnamed protein product [Moneuplotes crassus]
MPNCQPESDSEDSLNQATPKGYQFNIPTLEVRDNDFVNGASYPKRKKSKFRKLSIRTKKSSNRCPSVGLKALRSTFNIASEHSNIKQIKSKFRDNKAKVGSSHHYVFVTKDNSQHQKEEKISNFLRQSNIFQIHLKAALEEYK